MKILVTGANGHLGNNLVAALLKAGHTVRGSVRDAADPARTRHLAAQGPVELVSADVESEPALRAAMDGIDAVFHTAAVYTLFAPGRENEIIRASVEGVRNAMRAAKDARVRRFVLTSSCVALPLTRPGATPSTAEDWASDLAVPYIRAKTEAEKLGWKLADELKIDFAAVLPGAFGGPGFQRNTPTIDFVESIMKGSLQFGAPPINYPWVDVRDVVRAHLLVLEKGARGRFTAVNPHQPMLAEIAATMNAIDTSVPRPLMTLPGFVLPLVPWLEGVASRMTGAPRSMSPELAGLLHGKIWNISTEKSERELGWSPGVSLSQSLADTMSAIRALVRS